MQSELQSIGALGVQIHPIKSSVLNPREETLTEVQLDSLHESVTEYMAIKKYDDVVIDKALEILAET